MSKPGKREQIMRGAESLFTSRRLHEIKMDEIARIAGVGKGTIYLYFKSKDDLFFQIVISGFDELCDLLRQKVPADVPFVQQLLSLCVHISSFFNQRRQLFQMMQAEDKRMLWCKGAFRERWFEHRKKLAAAVAEVIDKGMKEGEIRTDIPADVLTKFLLGMLVARAHDLADAPQAMRRCEVVVDLFYRGAQKKAKGKREKAEV
jgi:TetR/AcrR family fatty acid metabolism transcriptional regulator